MLLYILNKDYYQMKWKVKYGNYQNKMDIKNNFNFIDMVIVILEM